MIATERTTVVHRVCSWCSRELRQEKWKRRAEHAENGDAEITTWGICPRCFELREGASNAGVQQADEGTDDVM